MALDAVIISLGYRSSTFPFARGGWLCYMGEEHFGGERERQRGRDNKASSDVAERH